MDFPFDLQELPAFAAIGSVGLSALEDSGEPGLGRGFALEGTQVGKVGLVWVKCKLLGGGG